MSKPLSSIDRPLSLRLRADLQAVEVPMSEMTTWILKDPVTLEHFQFSAEEHAILEWLRLPVSIAELQRRYAREFPPQKLTPEAVWDFLRRLHEAGLVVSDSPGQGDELLARMRRDRRQRWATSWMSLLSIRFRGIDPDSFLSAVNDEFGWLFRGVLVLPIAAIVAYAIWLVFGHFAEFRERLPELNALFDARNLPWLLVAIGSVKVLHELGHALTCKRFGGEVRELGLMLLVFAPCLYCDVSDAWRLPSKWRRIAVSGAGIMVELVLAAIATIAWWYAEPGMVQLISMNIMIVCTLNTLLVNGNPLMRYDGYYILSDFIETPNLWQRSRDVLHALVSRWFFARQEPADDPLLPASKRVLLCIYAIASKVYLTVVFAGILWGLVRFLYPYHLENVAYAVGMVMLGGALFGPVSGAARLMRNPLRRGEVRPGRLALAMAVGLAAVVGVLSIPVTYHVTAPLVLLPEDAARIHATVGGTLVEALPAGTQVKRGQRVARLTNSEADREIVRLEGERRLRQLRIEHLDRIRGVDQHANDELPTARAALADTERRLAERRGEAQRLELSAPIDGVVIPAPRIETRHQEELRLAKWSGSLLDAANLNARVEAGTLVCLVGDPSRLTAVLLVDESDVKRLQPGQQVRIRLDQLPGQVLDGEVVEVARHDVRDGDSVEAARADLAPLFAGLVPPGKTGALYQARVRLEGARTDERETKAADDGVAHSFAASSSLLLIGGRGQAKVTAERITIARLIARYFAQTFRLPT